MKLLMNFLMAMWIVYLAIVAPAFTAGYLFAFLEDTHIITHLPNDCSEKYLLLNIVTIEPIGTLLHYNKRFMHTVKKCAVVATLFL